MTFVSIIVPVYNVEKYLEQCVDSVLSQSFEDFELILVDDGSSDSSYEICRRYAQKDERVRAFTIKNSGAAGARNYGVERAEGEYILFLDSDDFYNSDDALQLLYSQYQIRHSDILLFGCTDWFMKTDTYVVTRNNYDLDIIDKKDYNEAFAYLLKNKLLPGGPTVFAAKRDLFEENNIVFRQGIQNEDYDFVLSVFTSAAGISAVNQPFYVYRHGRSDSVTSRTDLKMIYGIDFTLEKWYPICEKYPDERLKAELLNYLAFIYTTGFVEAGRMKKAERKKALEIMKKHRYILSFGYWKKTRLTRLAVGAAGMNLFSVAAAAYYNKTHM